MTDLDTRLRLHHQSLVDRLAADAARLDPAKTRRRRSPKLAWAAGAVAVAAVAGLVTARMLPAGTQTVTVNLPGLTVVSAAQVHTTPRLSAAQAQAVAYANLTRTGSPQLTGYTLTTTTFIPDVLRIEQQCGAHIGLPAHHDVWVVAYTAPPQGRWGFIRAAMVVDDATGQMLGGQVLMGPDGKGPLSTCHWGT